MTKKEVEKNESVMFDLWLSDTEAALFSFSSAPASPSSSSSSSAAEHGSSSTLGYFERNLDVWRQLWRVCEVSAILLVLVDARAPLLHFPPALQDYLCTLRPRKGVILVLTKTDLIPSQLVEQWEAYLEAEFGYRVVRAESYRPREASAQAQGKQRRRFDPAAPSSVREALTVALREAHDELMTAPERIRPERRHLWRPHPSLRRDIDWEELQEEPESVRPRKGKERPAHSAKEGHAVSKADAKKARKQERQQALQKDVSAVQVASSARTAPHRQPNEAMSGTGPGSAADEQSQSVKLPPELDDDEEGDHASNEAAEDEREQAPFLSIGLIGQPKSVHFFSAYLYPFSTFLTSVYLRSVGKSSLLNAMLGKAVVRASRTPGKTKSLQTIFWTPEVRLVDCPGLVFPSTVGMEMQVLAGVIPVQNVEAVIHAVGEKMPLEIVLGVKVHEDEQAEEGEKWSTDSLLTSLALQRGGSARSNRMMKVHVC